MQTLLKAILLGAVQGITEFLPISSTGHLILFEHILGISQDTYGLAFDAALHLGTLVAVLWFFREEWVKLLRVCVNVMPNLFRHPRRILKLVQDDNKNRDDKLILLLAIGTIPAVILGVFLEDTIDTLFRSPILVAVSLILFSFVLLYVEKIGKRQKEITGLKLLDSVIIGTAQAIALIPGVSRSGITMAAGMWRGLTREQSARFAFLLSAPIVAGAGGKKVIDVFQEFQTGIFVFSDLLFFATGIISATIFGYLTIKYFLKFISSNSLMPFILYRIILGLFIIGVSLL